MLSSIFMLCLQGGAVCDSGVQWVVVVDYWLLSLSDGPAGSPGSTAGEPTTALWLNISKATTAQWVNIGRGNKFNLSDW